MSPFYFSQLRQIQVSYIGWWSPKLTFSTNLDFITIVETFIMIKIPHCLINIITNVFSFSNYFYLLTFFSREKIKMGELH
jgi:hypothetical protein